MPKKTNVVPFPGFEDLAQFAEPPQSREQQPERILLPDPPAENVQITVRVTLDGSRPAIWRRVEVAGRMPLNTLHEVLCLMMGWEDAHLHRFRLTTGRRSQRFLTDWDLEEGESGTAEADARLDQVLRRKGDKLYWDYDFGDGWEHTIKAESVSPAGDDDPPALCLDGRNACPLEDCGGLGGHAEICDLIATDPERNDWPEHLQEWVPESYDPTHFDPAEANMALLMAGASLDDMLEGIRPSAEGLTLAPDVENFLRSLPPDDSPALAVLLGLALPGITLAMDDPPPALAGGRTTGVGTSHLVDEVPDDELAAAVRPWQVLLDMASSGTGLVLTGAGKLKPADMRSIASATGFAERWTGAMSQESQVPMMTTLRESAVRSGLLRRVKGRLVPTKRGMDVQQVPDRLLTALSGGLLAGRMAEVERAARTILVMHLATGLEPSVARSSTAEAMAELGWQTGYDEPIAVMHIFELTSPVRFMLSWMDDHSSDDHDELTATQLELVRRAVWVPTPK